MECKSLMPGIFVNRIIYIEMFLFLKKYRIVNITRVDMPCRKSTSL